MPALRGCNRRKTFPPFRLTPFTSPRHFGFERLLSSPARTPLLFFPLFWVRRRRLSAPCSPISRCPPRLLRSPPRPPLCAPGEGKPRMPQCSPPYLPLRPVPERCSARGEGGGVLRGRVCPPLLLVHLRRKYSKEIKYGKRIEKPKRRIRFRK